LFSLGLHLYNIQAIGDSNNVYTAAVKSMLQSWHNFFFLSAEPGGSVSLDKPPLGFWIQAAFAAVLGINGLSLALPNILAGILSIPLLYHLVKKYFGAGAGLTAALVLALTPVTLAVDRNNTIDGMLTFTLLLAAWAFLIATETGKLRYLLLGAFLVGLGFNIKMLAAFLPLPAFYTLYFFGAKVRWGRKILHLALASVLLGAISLSWVAAVDRVPASQRPFVGNTSNNSEMDLVFGYNGLKRVFGKMTGLRSRILNSLRGAAVPPASPSTVPNATNPNTGPLVQPSQFGGAEDIGQQGALRFFQAPLAKEMSWLLPIAIAAMVLAAFSGRVRLPVTSNEHKGLLLWGGWLVTCLVFFSVAVFFHNYYLVMLSPALAALVGMGVWEIARLYERSHFLAAALLLAVAGATVAFQYALVRQYGLDGIWMGPAVALLAAATLILLVRGRSQGRLFHLANIAALSAVLIIPALWSVWTVAYGKATAQPEAYTANLPIDSQSTGTNSGGEPAIGSGGAPDLISQSETDQSTLAFLQANTKRIKYLLAVPSSRTGAPLVLLTGRPVLFMGGYSGSDPVMNGKKLARLVATGQVRYVSLGGSGSRDTRKDIIAWVQSNCRVVPEFSKPVVQNFDGRGDASPVLYRCGH
jgi:4-amino-4-deoxy-L-arabinose transferase-like glycosyltransferase